MTIIKDFRHLTKKESLQPSWNITRQGENVFARQEAYRTQAAL